MDRNKVTEMLSNYPYYRYAIRCYEQSKGVPSVPIAMYDDMPRGGGFGNRMPKANDGLTLQDTLDYMEFKAVVNAIDGALETLKEDERNVIEWKWMRGLTLSKIDEKFHYSHGYSRHIHRRALKNMATCLRFAELPKLERVSIPA